MVAMKKFNLASVRNIFVSDLQRQVLSWPELVELFSAPPAEATDRDTWAREAVTEGRYSLFTPSDFLMANDPQAQRNDKGFRRCNENVLGKDLLILDVDNDIGKGRAMLSLEEAKVAFADYTYILYTSYNHRLAENDHADRFRIIIPLSSYCKKVNWILRTERMKSLWRFADPASFTLSQPFYFPVVHPDRKSDYVCWTNTGKSLDWDEVEPIVTVSNIAHASANQSAERPIDLTVHSITLADGNGESVYDLYHRLPEGYDHRERCFSPFRNDQDADCFVYRHGPSLCVWDNASGVLKYLPMFQREPTQVIADWFARHEEREVTHNANPHTTPAPPKPAPVVTKPAPLVEYPSPVIRIDERYLLTPSLNALPKKGLLFIKSPKGTGKTTVLEELMPVIKGRVLLLGHRITLLSALAEKLDLMDYQKSKSAKEDRLAICLDSLTRFSANPDSKETPYDTILIDESEQVLRHLTAETLKRRRRDVVNTLIRLIRNAKRVICLDADLTAELSIAVMAKLRGMEQLETDELVGYINDFKFTGRSIEMYPSRDQLIATLLDHVNQRQRFFVATNNREFAETLEVIVHQRWPEARIMMVSSRTSDLADVKAFLRDPEGKVTQYDIVIATPSMATGVSIDVEGHFAATFGFFQQRPSTYQDCDQAISRVRGNVPTKVWIQMVEHTKPPLPEDFFRAMAYERELTTRIRLPGERPEFTKGELLWFDIYARLRWLEEYWMHSKLERFIDLKVNTGHEVNFVEPDEQAMTEGFDAVIEANYSALRQEVEAILAAEDISSEELDRIRAKPVKSHDDEILLKRSLIQSHLGSLPFTYGNIYETLAKGHLRKRKYIEQVDAGLESNIEMDKRERAKSKRAVTDFSHRTKEFEGFTALLQAAEIDYPTMRANVIAMYDAKQQLEAVKTKAEPRSPARRAAFDAFNAETAGIDLSISKEQMKAVAELYFKNMYDYNLFFECRIKDPTNERNQAKVWNATFGKFGLPVRPLKKGGRNAQVTVYEIDYSRDGLMHKAVADRSAAFLAIQSGSTGTIQT